MTAALLAAAPLSAQTLTRRLLEDARDGRLVNFEFFAAALIASGVEDECELAGWLDLFTERRAELLSASSEGPASERSQALHVALHETILTGAYSISASDVRLALADGNFNCLSSLAIYFDLCRAAGLKMKICLERGHVFVISTDEEGTTKSIEPGAGWESRRSTHRGRHITPVELIGKFYYNRGVQALMNSQFAVGLDLLQTSLLFDPADRDARANLVAGLNNWAAEHCRARRYGEAMPLVEQGLLLDPFFAPLIANERLIRSRLAD